MPRRRPARARAAAALGALALVAGAAGCGQSDEGKVRDTLATFEKATAAHDYKKLCDDVLAKPLVQRLSNIGLPCEVALQRGLAGVTSPQLTVLRVKVRGDVALAVVRSAAAGQPTSGDTIRLVREGDDWRVSTLSGAQPPAPREQ
jgi:ketosteroid isomerase-like protein